jgi:hypothetical protein
MKSSQTDVTSGRSLSFYCDRTIAQPPNVWVVVRDFLEHCGLLRERYLMTFTGQAGEGGANHATVNPEQVAEVLRRERAASFTLRYDLHDEPRQMIRFGRATRSKIHASLNFETTAGEPRPQNWVPLIETLAESVRLAIAGTADREYNGWQHCADPQYYLAHYGPIDGFRILHPLSPPHNEVEKLDISRNPGRLDYIHGGPALVRADLWLGPAIWDYAPCRKEEVSARSWLKVRETEHFLYVKAYPEPFTRPDGEQGEIQRRLWQLLFHSDCRWPPGEGGPQTCGG